MNKNLEEFKENKDILTDWEAIQLAFKILEDFEERLKIVEDKLGIYYEIRKYKKRLKKLQDNSDTAIDLKNKIKKLEEELIK